MTKVWSNCVDNIYPVYVERNPDDPYRGKLCVEFEGKVIFSEEVTISYAARFGPDACDVSLWGDTCVNFVDSITEEDKVRFRNQENKS